MNRSTTNALFSTAMFMSFALVAIIVIAFTRDPPYLQRFVPRGWEIASLREIRYREIDHRIEIKNRKVHAHLPDGGCVGPGCNWSP